MCDVKLPSNFFPFVSFVIRCRLKFVSRTIPSLLHVYEQSISIVTSFAMSPNPDPSHHHLLLHSLPKFRAPLILRRLQQLWSPLSLSNSWRVHVNSCIQKECWPLLHKWTRLPLPNVHSFYHGFLDPQPLRHKQFEKGMRVQKSYSSSGCLIYLYLFINPNLWNKLQGPHERVWAFSTIEGSTIWGSKCHKFV